MGDLFARSSAIISDCGKYRYRLDRRWADGKTCGFIMLNPSTADAEIDDPTIRRCIGFAKREGCGALIVLNLFAFRATKPDVLWATRPDVRHGPESSKRYDEALTQIDGPIIAAWGAITDVEALEVAGRAIWFHGTRLMCLGKTKDGHPRHPLYVRGDAPLTPFMPTPTGHTHTGG